MPRIYLTEEPFIDRTKSVWRDLGEWPAWWIDHPQRPHDVSSAALFRLRFRVAEAGTATIHVTADHRYHLYLDGQALGRGPERGDPKHWRFESFSLELTSGEHVLVAMNWWLTPQDAPYAQMSVHAGFLLAAEGDWQAVLTTGIAPWETALIPGISFLEPDVAWGTGARVRVDAAGVPWGWQAGAGDDWQPATRITTGESATIKSEVGSVWLLTPATLPPMLEEERHVGVVRHLTDGNTPYPVHAKEHLAAEADGWQTWLAGTAQLTLPPHTSRRAIIDLQQYYCAYPVLRTSGGAGACIRLHWAEALYEPLDSASKSVYGSSEPSKGNREEVDGKEFIGTGDEFLPDGGKGRDFTTLWWEAGRYLELTVTTAAEPLTLESFTLFETRYPLEMAGTFRASDERLAAITPIMVRAMQMCAHETYMDCPYYEQLMYVGDTRLEVLTTYTMTADDRLPRKALTTFDHSRMHTGFTSSRFPTKMLQIIAPFSLWWVGMVYDYWLWRDDPAFVRGLLPGVRAVLEGFRALVSSDGLLQAPEGWNFTDWVPGWEAGVPPTARTQPSGILNLHLALALQYKAQMEACFGEAELAARDRATAARTLEVVLAHYWHDGRGLIADDMAQTSFSEHAQCLAVLTGLLPAATQARVAAGLLHADDLARTTIYFTHYLFETYYRLGCAEALFDRLGLWFELPKWGFTTTFECPEPSRSDCHAWGAHPLHHYCATLLGIRPDGPGFSRVRIAPLLGPLTWAEGTLPHPQGEIRVRLQRDGADLHADITLPPGVTGVLVWNGEERMIG